LILRKQQNQKKSSCRQPGGLAPAAREEKTWARSRDVLAPNAVACRG
jgi:hypothetical protein